MRSLTARLVAVSLVFTLVVAIAPPVSSQMGSPASPRESAEKEGEKQRGTEGSVAENAALGTASAIVSSAQIPLRVVACGATIVVAGLAYVLTAFDREARQGPADAIGRVCGGSYVTSPRDLKGRGTPDP